MADTISTSNAIRAGTGGKDARAAREAGSLLRTALLRAAGVPHCADTTDAAGEAPSVPGECGLAAPLSPAGRPGPGSSVPTDAFGEVSGSSVPGDAVRAAYPEARLVRSAAGTARREGRSPKPKASRSGQGSRSAATASASERATVTRTTSPNFVQAPASTGSTW